MKSRQSQYEHESQNGYDSSEDESRQERPHGGRKRGRSSGGGTTGGNGGSGNGAAGGEKSKQKLYCICRQPDDGSPMFQCDGCKEWFHPKCLGYSELDMNKMKSKKTYCLDCASSAESKEPRKRSLDGSSEPSSSAVDKASSSNADGGKDTVKSADGNTPDVSSSSAQTTSTSTSTPAEPSKKKTKTYVWNGSLKSEGFGSVNLAAQYVCGTTDMIQLIPASLILQKRLPLDKLLDYLHICSVNSTRKRCVLRLEPSGSDSDLQAYNSLHKYFLNRNRAGYVEIEGASPEGYEMMYLLPLQCNATSLPAFISQDANATLNKRVVTSGAQKPRFLLILIGGHNSAVASSEPVTAAPTTDADKPCAEADAVKQESKISSSTTTTTTNASSNTDTVMS